jgi:uncharacterized membrane protein YebE (DUF533 family)
MDRIARTVLDRLLSGGAGRSMGGRGGTALGLAAMLMGGRRRRGFSRNALLAAGAGALGKVALDAWRKGHEGQSPGRPLAELPGDGDEAEERATTLLLAMVAAAKADGHVDEEEESAIEAEMEGLPVSARAMLADMLRTPASPEEVARRTRSEQEGREVYAASALLCGRDHPGEAAFLDRLADALGLSRGEARDIEEGLLGAV